jgi:hypothetical protein
VKCPRRRRRYPPPRKSACASTTRRSWIITTEVNRFIWRGPDLRPAPGGGYSYGWLPGAMTRDLIAQVKADAQDESLLVVGRTE